MARPWSVWIVVWCWLVIAFGALLVTAAVPGVDGAVRALFVLFSGDAGTAEVFDHPALRFAVGLQGALTIGWGLTMLALVKTPSIGARQWQALTVALLVWYVIDSGISVMTGFWLNAVSNTVLTIGFLVPVLASGALRDARG